MNSRSNKTGQHKGEATPLENALSGSLARSWPFSGFGMGVGRVSVPLGAQIELQRVHVFRRLYRVWGFGVLVRVLAKWLVVL